MLAAMGHSSKKKSVLWEPHYLFSPSFVCVVSELLCRVVPGCNYTGSSNKTHTSHKNTKYLAFGSPACLFSGANMTRNNAHKIQDLQTQHRGCSLI